MTYFQFEKESRIHFVVFKFYSKICQNPRLLVHVNIKVGTASVLSMHFDNRKLNRWPSRSLYCEKMRYRNLNRFGTREQCETIMTAIKLPKTLVHPQDIVDNAGHIEAESVDAIV